MEMIGPEAISSWFALRKPRPPAIGSRTSASGSDQGIFAGRALQARRKSERSRVSTTAPVPAEFAVAVYPVGGTSRLRLPPPGPGGEVVLDLIVVASDRRHVPPGPVADLVAAIECA
jgi:hypothetical protein